MRKIDIVFTKSKKFMPILSWSIQLWTWKPYSHVARHKDIMDESMYYQASEGKVNYEHEDVFSKKHEIIKTYTLNIPDDLERAMGKECLKQAGKPYAFLQNLGIMWVDINAIFGRKVNNPWKNGKNCSELLYETVFKALDPSLNYDPNTIKPHHIEEIILGRFGHLVTKD